MTNESTTSLETVLAETGLEWSFESAGFTTRLGQCRIAAETQGECAVFRTELAQLKDPSPESLAAIGDFVQALNSRLRVARGSLKANAVLLEIFKPAAGLTVEEIKKAVEVLNIGHTVARRECAALLNQAVARHYLDFHKTSAKEIREHDNVNSSSY